MSCKCLAAGLAFLSLRRTRLLRQIDTDSESSGGLRVTVPPKLQPEQATPARLKHGPDVSRPPLAAITTSAASHPAHSVRQSPAAEPCLTPCPPAMLQAVRRLREGNSIEEGLEGQQPSGHSRLSSRGFPGGWVMDEDVKTGRQEPSTGTLLTEKSSRSVQRAPAR